MRVTSRRNAALQLAPLGKPRDADGRSAIFEYTGFKRYISDVIKHAFPYVSPLLSPTTLILLRKFLREIPVAL
jgi:hypothetical protein